VPGQNIPSNVAVHHLRTPCKHNPMGRPFDSMKGPGVPQGYCLPTTLGIPIASHTQLTAKGNLQCQLFSSGHTFVGPTAGAFIAEAEWQKTRELPIIRRFRGAFLAEVEGRYRQKHGRFQLSEGSVLMQQEKPVVFFARNLTSCFVVVPYLCITSTTNLYFKPSAFFIGFSFSRNIAHSLLL
jgi:hypothetical protein